MFIYNRISKSEKHRKSDKKSKKQSPVKNNEDTKKLQQNIIGSITPTQQSEGNNVCSDVNHDVEIIHNVEDDVIEIHEDSNEEKEDNRKHFISEENAENVNRYLLFQIIISNLVHHNLQGNFCKQT